MSGRSHTAPLSAGNLICTYTAPLRYRLSVTRRLPRNRHRNRRAFITLSCVCGFKYGPGRQSHGGYNKIQHPRRKNILIDYETLSCLAGFDNFESFQSAHRRWGQSALSGGAVKREDCWTQSIASGNRSFVEAVKRQMHSFAIGRRVWKKAEGFELREPHSRYKACFDTEKTDIEGKNLWF